ncbi:MAG: response regulator [Planctomycetales bacterium]
MQKRALRIAIADDEVDMRDFLQKILPRLGHDVVCVAEGGNELVDEVLRTKPDLVITDLKMPDGDGLTAVSRIWEEHPVPVIIISAYPQDMSARPVRQDLIAAVLVKPVKSIDLERAIEKLIAQLPSSE